MVTGAPATVTVRVLLFASYAEQLGRESLEVSISAPATVAGVLDQLRALPGGRELPARPLCARNLAHVSLDAPVSAGDEVAVLPPLAGG
jgi:molybdopterin converting factor small subunit